MYRIIATFAAGFIAGKLLKGNENFDKIKDIAKTNSRKVMEKSKDMAAKAGSKLKKSTAEEAK